MSRAEEKKDSTINSSALDVALRPKLWKHYIGQEQIKKTLSILMGAAKGRGEPIEHILLYGPAGLGKTTLAHLISHEMGTQIKVTSGPVIERVGDLAALLTNMSSGDILFIDEIHRMNKLVEEVLYSAMESRVLDIIIGKGPSARIIQLDLPPFTLLAATTRISLLSSPLRSRFSGGIYRLDFYKDSEIKEIIKRSSAALGTNITEDAINEIAMRSRCTPRASNHLLKRCRDVAEVDGENQISYKVALKTLKLLGIDSMGLGGGRHKVNRNTRT